MTISTCLQMSRLYNEEIRALAFLEFGEYSRFRDTRLHWMEAYQRGISDL